MRSVHVHMSGEGGLAGDHPTSKEIALLPTTCLTTHTIKARKDKNHTVHLVAVETKSQRKAFSKPQQHRWWH